MAQQDILRSIDDLQRDVNELLTMEVAITSLIGIKLTQTLTDTGTMGDAFERCRLNKATVATVTLPTHLVDKEIRLFNKGAGTWTLSPTSGNIKGSATDTLLQFESLIIMSDGTDWD